MAEPEKLFQIKIVTPNGLIYSHRGSSVSMRAVDGDRQILYNHIALAFQAVKAVKIENLIRSDKPFEAQTFLIFTAIALGYLVAQFVISFIDSSLQLSNLF